MQQRHSLFLTLCGLNDLSERWTKGVRGLGLSPMVQDLKTVWAVTSSGYVSNKLHNFTRGMRDPYDEA